MSSSSYQQYPVEPPRRRRPRWPIFLAVVAVAALALIVLAATAANNLPSEPSARGIVPVTTGSVPARVAPTPTPEPEDVSGPLSTFGSGTYEVGSGDGQVAPGKYKTTGPEGSICYWARLKSTEGGVDSIIANGTPQGPSVVTINAKDAAFETTGCTWTKS